MELSKPVHIYICRKVLIHLDNVPNPGQGEDKVLMFFKRRPDVINPDNMHR